MATSAAELQRIKDELDALARFVGDLLAVEKREEAASRKLGEPAPRLARIP